MWKKRIQTDRMDIKRMSNKKNVKTKEIHKIINFIALKHTLKKYPSHTETIT